MTAAAIFIFQKLTFLAAEVQLHATEKLTPTAKADQHATANFSARRRDITLLCNWISTLTTPLQE